MTTESMKTLLTNDEKITIEYKGDYRKGLAENRKLVHS